MLTRRYFLIRAAGLSAAALTVTLPVKEETEDSPVVWDTGDWRDGLPVREETVVAGQVFKYKPARRYIPRWTLRARHHPSFTDPDSWFIVTPKTRGYH